MTKKLSPKQPVQGTVILPMMGGSYILQEGQLSSDPEDGSNGASLPVESPIEGTLKPETKTDDPKAES